MGQYIPRQHADTAIPPIVSQSEWALAREALLEAEKQHTRAGDAVAAIRRRLPMVAVDAEDPLTSVYGKVSLLEVFEGRRQLIMYHHMLRENDDDPCSGCSAFVDSVPHLAQLYTTDVTMTVEAIAPIDQLRAYMDKMGRTDIPVYSSSGTDFRDRMHLSPHGPQSFGLSVFLRDHDRVYRTYFTQGRGVQGVPLIDLTPFGRQESFEDSPAGWPQRPTYSFEKVHYNYTADELAGLMAPSTTGQLQ